jgi:hypothetical protein
MYGKLKVGLILLAGALVNGCSTARVGATDKSLSGVDPTLSRERSLREFERRLYELGGQIEQGAAPEVRIATVVIPNKRSYLPPQTVRIGYVVVGGSTVVIRSVAGLDEKGTGVPR